MGWWETGHGDDLIGDPPADTLSITLRDIASFCEEQQQNKPTLQEVLDAIASVLRMRSSDILEDGEGIIVQRLIAELGPNFALVSGGERDLADAYLITVFSEAFETISLQYQLVIERKPRFSELLSCVKFRLCGALDEYLLIEEDTFVKKFSAETINC